MKAMATTAAAPVVKFASRDRDTLALSGPLTFVTASQAWTEARRLLARGAPTRLDLAGLTRVDSAGLACVVGWAADSSRNGRKLQVVNPPEGLCALAEVCEVAPLLGMPATPPQ
jgi:phospholipid transport system transporter-binding protein